MGRTASSEVLPIWRSDIQPVILHRLSLGRDRTASDIAASSGLDPVLVARRARQLADAGILTVEPLGAAKVLRLSPDHPAVSHLVALANLSVGLLIDLEALHRIDGVVDVVVFGSWARRHHGEPGRPPRDIDVFVELRPGTDPWPVHESCAALGGRHGVAVDVTALAGDDAAAFASTYLSGPTIRVRPPRDR